MLTLAELAAENLSCVRGSRLVFRDVALSLAAGDVLSVEGPNGSGKTSLLRMLAGFIAPQRGVLRLRDGSGVDVLDAEERGKFVGWLAHQDAAKAQLTPLENLQFHAALYAGVCDAPSLLQAVGLGRVSSLPCQYLSAGQKRRLALARLRVCERPLWLLDEPFSALDGAGKTLVLEMIARHRALGGIVVAATHEPLGISCKRFSFP